MSQQIAPQKRPSFLKWSEIQKWTSTASLLRFKNIPEDWRLLKVSDFATLLNNKESVVPDKNYQMAGVRWYGEGVFHRETVLGKDQSASYLSPLKQNTVIYNRLFAWKESFAVVTEESNGLYVSNEFPQFEIDKQVALPDYIYLLFISKKLIRVVNASSVGSSAVSRNRFKENDFLDFKVPIPPLPIQNQIVEHWKTLTGSINSRIALSKKITNRIPHMLVTEVGLHGLGKTHSRRAFRTTWRKIERWGVNIAREMTRKPDLKASPFPIVSLSDVIEDLQNGWSPKCHTRPAQIEEWGVLKVGAVSFGWFDESQNKALPKSLKPLKQHEVASGDLIISRANITQYVGACALVNQVRSKLMLCDKLFRVVWKTDSLILPEYLNEILKIPHLRWQIENKLTGASPTMKNISKPALLSLKFPLPPLEIQRKIMDIIEARREESRTLLSGAQKKQEEVSKQMEKLILGTLSVEDL